MTDFGHILRLFSRDPDGLEVEVCVLNPDARRGVRPARHPVPAISQLSEGDPGVPFGPQLGDMVMHGGTPIPFRGIAQLLLG